MSYLTPVQHAADERIRLEELRSKVVNGKLTREQLLNRVFHLTC